MKRKRQKRPRTRVRAVSLQDLEAVFGAKDSEFKKKVLHALSERSKSPAEELIEREEAPKERDRDIQDKRRFNRIVKYAGLTQEQLACYKLSKSRRKPTLEKIAKKLGIGVSSAWSRLKRAERKIERLFIRFLEGKRIEELIPYAFYRPVVRNVFHLYYERGWPPKKIAKALHRDITSIYKNIRRIRWLAHQYSPKEAARPWVFEIESKKITGSVQKPSKKPRHWTP